jgi:hypothetical protein
LPIFTAEVQFRFECESLEQSGRSLRTLAEAARRAGFELTGVKVEPTSESRDDGTGWTGYGPDTSDHL